MSYNQGSGRICYCRPFFPFPFFFFSFLLARFVVWIRISTGEDARSTKCRKNKLYVPASELHARSVKIFTTQSAILNHGNHGPRWVRRPGSLLWTRRRGGGGKNHLAAEFWPGERHCCKGRHGYVTVGRVVKESIRIDDLPHRFIAAATSASMYAADSSVTRWLSRVLVTPPDRISPPDLRLCGVVWGLPHTNSIGSPKYVRMGSYLVSDAYHGFGDNHLKKEKKRLYRFGGPVVNLPRIEITSGVGRWGLSRNNRLVAPLWGGFRACVSWS